MNCPMAVLTEETKTSEVSKLPSAAFIPFSHPSGFILMKSKIAFGRKIRKIIVSQLIRGNNKLILFYIYDRLMGR